MEKKEKIRRFRNCVSEKMRDRSFEGVSEVREAFKEAAQECSLQAEANQEDTGAAEERPLPKLPPQYMDQ